jgi:hypothetical protein
VTLVILYPFFVWYVCKYDSCAHILCAFGLTLKPGVTATLHVKDAKDRASLAEREEMERVSRAKVENTTVLASAREDAEGFVWKISLLEGELAVERQGWEASMR